MFEPLTTKQFDTLLKLAIVKYNLDPRKTYLELTWWDHIFKPCIACDANNSTNEFVIVFSDINCQKWSDNIPCGFYIYNGAVIPNNVVHYPMTINHFINNEFMLGFDTVKFMLSGGDWSPVNVKFTINPFKTTLYINRENENILTLYAEDRDSGEWESFDNFTSNRIRLVDNSYKQTKYKGDGE